VADVQSRGLIPQLTDVLSALTTSHELLLFNLRVLRREQAADRDTASDAPSYADSVLESFSAEPCGVTQPRSLALTGREVVRKCAASHDAVMDERGFTNSSRRSAEKSAVQTPPEPYSPLQTRGIDAPSHCERDDVAPSQSSTQSVPLANPGQPEERHLDSNARVTADRDYNFFDELDARLTHVKVLDPGSRGRDSTEGAVTRD
jgi:hypothetical protein